MADRETRPPGLSPARARGGPRGAGRRVRLGRRPAGPAEARRHLAAQRLGGRARPALLVAGSHGLSGRRARSGDHARPTSSATRRRSSPIRPAWCARGRRAGAEADPLHPDDARRHCPGELHGQASLRRGMDRDRHLERACRSRPSRRWWSRAGGPVPAVRFVRRELLQRLGPQERDAPADHPGLRLQRPAAQARSRRAAPALLADQAGLQDDEVPHRG